MNQLAIDRHLDDAQKTSQFQSLVADDINGAIQRAKKAKVHSGLSACELDQAQG